MNPTYRELAQWISTFSKEQLDSNVTVYNGYDNETMPVGTMIFNCDEHLEETIDTLDLDHPILNLE
jgi:hypothetical protein